MSGAASPDGSVVVTTGAVVVEGTTPGFGAQAARAVARTTAGQGAKARIHIIQSIGAPDGRPEGFAGYTQYRTIAAILSGSSEAPPTRPPSMSRLAMSPAMLPGFTDPP